MPELSIDIYKNIHQQKVIDHILSVQHEFEIPISLEAQPDLNNIPDYYQINNGNFWIARAGEEVIGTISLLNIGNDQGALRKMFVNRNYRGKKFGVGQKLLDTLMDWAKEKKFKKIFLGTTAKFVRAQHFYEKNGFAEIDKFNLPATFPLVHVDVKFYCKSL
jgi:GNAT superfamily N-acetyltransferase